MTVPTRTVPSRIHSGADLAEVMRAYGIPWARLELRDPDDPAWDPADLLADLSEVVADRWDSDRRAWDVESWPVRPTLPGASEPDAIPLDALPPVLRDVVATVAASVQVSPCMPAGLALAAVSAAVADRVVVRPDNAWREEPVPLYVVVVAPPAARKSPVYAILTPPLREWEDARAREAGPRRRVAEALVEGRSRALAAAQREGSDDQIEAAVLALQEAEEAVPVIPRLLAQDSTPEALVRQMQEQGGRVAVLSPEGGPLRILDGRYSDGVARLEELASAYDGEEIRVGRVGRPDVRVPRPILTLGVMLQPSVLEVIRNGRSLRGQGIYGRITWIVPQSRVGNRVDSSEAPPLDRRAVTRYRNMLHHLLDWAPRGQAADRIPVPHELMLSPPAQSHKREYHAEVEAALAPGGELAGITDWSGKLVGRAVRVAALLDLAARADEGRPLTDPVSGWAMASAVKLCRTLTTHALAVYGEMDADPGTAIARYVLGRARGLPDGSTFRDLHRACQGHGSIASADDLYPVVEDLAERGCIRLVAESRDGPGRPRSPRLEIHPALRTRSDRIDGSRSDSGSTPETVNSVKAGACESEGGEVPDLLAEGR